MSPISRSFVVFAIMIAAPCAGTEVELDPMTQVINEGLQRAWDEAGITPAVPSGDRDFVRRVYLDLAGRVPRLAEVDAFLADQRPDKRTRLVHLLTEREDFVQHFADVFDTLLMGRGEMSHYAERRQHGWREYLERVFRDNRPWNDVIGEILLARPDGQHDRGSVWFIYERKDEHQQIAEAVAPAVFGIRVECAQCHDHPLADEIRQAHYWGLVAFFNRGKNVQTNNGPRVNESAIGGFSEFADLSGKSHPNLLSFLQAETIEETRPEKGVKEEDRDDLYRPASLEGDPRVPKFSRREKFSEEVAASHPLVARAMVNRLWAVMMGRGIVHPFDEMDSAHAPSHPELLDQLSKEFEASNYDIRRFVRAVAASRPYQLSGIRPSGMEDRATFAWYLERPLTAEQLSRSIQLVVIGEFQNDVHLLHKIRERIGDVMPDEQVTTIKHALFLTNGAALDTFLNAANQPHHLCGKLKQIESVGQRVDLLFQTVFARHPDEAEEEAVIAYLRGDVADDARIHQVIWSMLTSAEFRFNH